MRAAAGILGLLLTACASAAIPMPVIAIVSVEGPAPVDPGPTGELRGRVFDEKGRPVLLVTMIVFDGPRPAETSEFTDTSGECVIRDLPPGRYEALLLYGEMKGRVSVDIVAGQATTVTALLDMSQPFPVITIHHPVPTIDISTAEHGRRLGPDELRNLPYRSRTASDALDAPMGPLGH